MSPYIGAQGGGARVLPKEINRQELGHRGSTQQSWRARRGRWHRLTQWGGLLQGLKGRFASAHKTRHWSAHSLRTVHWDVYKTLTEGIVKGENGSC